MIFDRRDNTKLGFKLINKNTYINRKPIYNIPINTTVTISKGFTVTYTDTNVSINGQLLINGTF